MALKQIMKAMENLPQNMKYRLKVTVNEKESSNFWAET
jgi:hypothetical protein